MKEIFARRPMLLPGPAHYDLKTHVLTGAGTGDGTGGTVAYYYGFGDPVIGAIGDLIWLDPGGTQYIIGDGIDPSGFDDRFSGLYMILGLGNNSSHRNWRLVRHPDLNTTQKFREIDRIWLMDEASFKGASWSDVGTPCRVFLPYVFELNATRGPRLGVEPDLSPISFPT